MSVQFQERFVDADGFHMRYQEAGQGEPLVHFHGGGGLLISPAHELLAEHYRLIAFEVPGFGQSPANDRSQSMEDLARTMGAAVSALGIDRFSLWGTSFGGKLALWLTILQPERVAALVLEAPAAILPESAPPGSGGQPQDALRRLYHHPERLPASPPEDPEVRAKQMALVRRIWGPPRNEAMEARMSELTMPVLVVFGTEDKMISPDVGRIYREKLPNSHFVLVYDAGHGVQVDRPEAFTALVTDFLSRHEQFVVNRDSALINP